jgi:hypothetical protein
MDEKGNLDGICRMAFNAKRTDNDKFALYVPWGLRGQILEKMFTMTIRALEKDSRAVLADLINDRLDMLTMEADTDAPK